MVGRMDGRMGHWPVPCGLWHGRRRERMKMGMGMGMVCQREGLAESAVLLPGDEFAGCSGEGSDRP